MNGEIDLTERQILNAVIKKTENNLKSMEYGFYNFAENGIYRHKYSTNWTAGFWPGMLWLAYKYTGDKKFEVAAKEIERILDDKIKNYYPLSHDVGFMWLLTSGANYAINKGEDSKRRLLHMANILAGRFNIKGKYKGMGYIPGAGHCRLSYEFAAFV